MLLSRDLAYDISLDLEPLQVTLLLTEGISSLVAAPVVALVQDSCQALVWSSLMIFCNVDWSKDYLLTYLLFRNMNMDGAA